MPTPGLDLSPAACLERHRSHGGRFALAVATSVDSTNGLARRVADAYLGGGRPVPHAVLLARGQTAGRGRRGRVWISPAGGGIYASLLLPVEDAETLAALPLAVPLALCEALEAAGVECGIKWPNDLVAGGRKLGGVLIEVPAGARAVIVGYGINGNQNEAELPLPGSTSLRLESGAAVDLSRLAVDLAYRVLERLRTRESPSDLVEAYRRRSVHRPGDRLRLRLGDEEVAGRFAGFDERGRLRLDSGAGVRTLGSAEMLEDEGARP